MTMLILGWREFKLQLRVHFSAAARRKENPNRGVHKIRSNSKSGYDLNVQGGTECMLRCLRQLRLKNY